MDNFARPLILIIALLPSITVGQAGLQGPFIPIEQTGPSTTSGGTTTSNWLWQARDTNGNDVYTEAPVSMTEAEVAQRMRDNTQQNNNAGHCGTLEGLGYVCDPSVPTVRHDPGENPEEYGYVDFCGQETSQDYSLTECWLMWVDYMENEYGGAAVIHPTNPIRCASNTRVNFHTNTGVFTYWQFGGPGAFPPCSDYIGGIPPPIDENGGDPVDDSTLNNLATSPTIKNNFVDNRRFYTNINNSSINMNYSYFSSVQTTITNNYSSATGTTAGSTSYPDGYANSPGGLGLPNPGTGNGGTGSGGEGEGGGGGDCVDFPNSFGCLDASTGSIPAPEELGSEEIGVSYTPVEITGVSGCPTPDTETVHGVLIGFNNDYLCSGLQDIRPIVIALFSLAGLYIVIGFRRAQ